MSAHYCEHGRVTSDQCGEYRCYECEPITGRDLAHVHSEHAAAIDELRGEVKALRLELLTMSGRVMRLEFPRAARALEED